MGTGLVTQEWLRIYEPGLSFVVWCNIPALNVSRRDVIAQKLCCCNFRHLVREMTLRVSFSYLDRNPTLPKFIGTFLTLILLLIHRVYFFTRQNWFYVIILWLWVLIYAILPAKCLTDNLKWPIINWTLCRHPKRRRNPPLS